jgi:tungstate transport system substrate-binding protein
VIRITALLVSIFVAGTAQADERFITLGSATSAQHSGLFDHILPIFRSASGINVHVIEGTTGKIVAIG